MISTKGVKIEERPEVNYLVPGINLVTIEAITMVKSKDERTEVAKFTVKDKEGNTGKVNLGIYKPVGDAKAIDAIAADLAIIADVCGVRAKVDDIKADTLEQFIPKYLPFVKDKFFWCIITGTKGDTGWFLDKFRVYFVGKKGDPNRITHITALPEPSVYTDSIVKEAEKGCIISIKYKKPDGGDGFIKWDPKNEYDLKKAIGSSTTTADEDVTGSEVDQPVF